MRQCRDEDLSDSGAKVNGPLLKRHKIPLELKTKVAKYSLLP